MHLGRLVRKFEGLLLGGRLGAAEGFHTSDDGVHRCIDSALLFGSAVGGQLSDGEYGDDRNESTSSKGGNYLTCIGHQ
jgi:hypothetical protein